MRQRFLVVMNAAVIVVVVSLTMAPVAGQAPRPGSQGQAVASSAQAVPPRTQWGEPDLQGIWTIDYQTPMQRPAKYAGKEFFTDAELAQLDKERAAKPAFGE